MLSISRVVALGCLMSGFFVVQCMPDGMQRVLNEHNLYRCMHGVPALTWDDHVAATAQQWADQGTCDKLAHDPNNNYGENIAWQSPAPSPSNLYVGVDRWYNEIKYTNNGRTDHFSMQAGHYTQVVWKDSARLGCGTCGGTMVCRYDPPGNYQGAFNENVNSPEKSRDQCSAPQRAAPQHSAPQASAQCAQNPGCQGLAGMCCPTIDGVRLDCCSALSLVVEEGGGGGFWRTSVGVMTMIGSVLSSFVLMLVWGVRRTSTYYSVKQPLLFGA